MAKSTTQSVHIPERLVKYLDEITSQYGSFSKFVQTAIELKFQEETGIEPEIKPGHSDMEPETVKKNSNLLNK